MSDSIAAQFDLVVEELERLLMERRRDSNVVLERDRGRLKIRLLIDPGPSPTWLAWTLAPQLELGLLTPEQIAANIIAGWESAIAADQEPSR